MGACEALKQDVTIGSISAVAERNRSAETERANHGYFSYFGEAPHTAGRPIDLRKAGEDAARRVVARGPRTPAPLSCNVTNCSAIGLDAFVKQPPELQRILAKSFKDPALWFDRLDRDRRTALAAIFNRLCGYRLWCYVSAIIKVAPGEKPVIIADRVFGVPGATPSVFFMSIGGNRLIDALMATGRFCLAKGIGASQHPGQTTLREISGSDSLHVSVGPGDQFDAHIDKFSPVTEHPGSSFCSNLPSRDALTHIGRELVPEIIRKKLHVPGVQVFPEPPPRGPRPELTPRSEMDPLPIGITVRGPIKRERPRPVLAEPLLPADVVARIHRALKEQVSSEALLPSHVRVRLTRARQASQTPGGNQQAARRALEIAQQEASSYPEAREFALNLAERMERARRSRAAWLKIDLPQYGGGDFGSRKAIAGEIRRIALVLRNYLPDRAQNLRTIVIIFGSANLASREEVKL